MSTSEPRLVATSIGNDRVCVDVPVSDAVPWFVGHFPSDPVLPGVAMLVFVEEAIRALSPAAERPGHAVREFRRVRFRAKIGSDVGSIRVTVQRLPNHDKTFEFSVEADGVLACGGCCEVG